MDGCWRPAWVALGANLGDPPATVRSALARLAALPDTLLVRQSRLWRSKPMGPQDQPDFVNAVAGLLTRLAPETLLDALRGIEREFGRAEPAVRWGPRVLDLDLLMVSWLVVDSPVLRLPHPGMPARSFVLYPLAEISPELFVPGHGRVRQLLRQVDNTGLEPLTAQDSRD